MKELKTVILVDDDETTNLLNEFFISQLDSRIKTVKITNGEDAIVYLEHNKAKKLGPCLLLLDIDMPLMDGWEFLEEYELRFKTEFKEKIHIVITSALKSPEITKRGQSNSNVAGIIQKPLSDLKLRMLIQRLFITTDVDILK